MSKEIEEARARHMERKLAAGAVNTQSQDESVARAVFSGLDIDFDEIMRLRNDIVAAPMAALAGGIPIHEVLLGFWVDGMAVGLLMAEKRDDS